ncbi:TetR/AcrR family transcriptional regulator [Arthrobacter sp. Sa2CUA1]|uniref:TetR/AcrR family transcriptional regulator n=1 Tax=Arthrobacter gallicola TaxID=2762225 RepID=A0ABR8UUI5_9MICC|nr:TetR family transcriptional regulator C-terminal domain-containing protein [Arthrobacter gallicola]MBD7996202.1 TetR/AcrR family transcriptional regulator [Arthrobacter gallicola]
MLSNPTSRVRKHPDVRRAEILAAAASIALADGLEGITLRAVAARLGVRPGLISHYYPAAEGLVVAAFARAVSDEREDLFPSQGNPLMRVASLISRNEGEGWRELSQLWLNARHLCRFSPALAEAVQVQEGLTHSRLARLIEEGVAGGYFTAADTDAASSRILTAIDGVGTYVNNTAPHADEGIAHFVSDVAEWALGIPAGQLRAAVDRQ